VCSANCRDPQDVAGSLGGVAFATPPKPGHKVSEGSEFKLHAEAKDDWQQ
jgi:hypothetical protein